MTVMWPSHDLCVLYLLFSLLQGHLSLALGSAWIIQDVLNSRSLTYMCKEPFPNKIIVLGSRDLDKDISFGATIQSTAIRKNFKYPLCAWHRAKHARPQRSLRQKYYSLEASRLIWESLFNFRSKQWGLDASFFLLKPGLWRYNLHTVTFTLFRCTADEAGLER